MQMMTPYGADNAPALDSREVAEMVGKRHADLLREIETYTRYLSESTERKIALSDFFQPSNYQDSTGRTLRCFHITRMGCDFIANKLTGPKGTMFTAAYINRFHDMERRLSIPQTLPEALRLAADLAEANGALNQKVLEDAPKVRFADAVAASEKSILVGELAKLLTQNGVPDMGEKRLFAWLRKEGYLLKHGERYNHPSQRSVEMRLLEMKAGHYVKRGTLVNTLTPMVTGKGQVYFINQFLK